MKPIGVIRYIPLLAYAPGVTVVHLRAVRAGKTAEIVQIRKRMQEEGRRVIVIRRVSKSHTVGRHQDEL